MNLCAILETSEMESEYAKEYKKLEMKIQQMQTCRQAVMNAVIEEHQIKPY